MSRRKEPRLLPQHEAALKGFQHRGERLGRSDSKRLRRLVLVGYITVIDERGAAGLRLYRLTERGAERLRSLVGGA